MLKKNNSGILSLAIVFLALASLPILAKKKPASMRMESCPVINSAEEAVRAMIKADMKGARLKTGSLDILIECQLESDDGNAWDHVQIVENDGYDPCKKAKEGCVLVKYVLLGMLYAGDKIQMRENPKFMEVELIATKKGNKWFISGLDSVPPLVSPKALLEHLQTLNSNGSEEWVDKSIDSLKPLSSEKASD